MFKIYTKKEKKQQQQQEFPKNCTSAERQSGRKKIVAADKFLTKLPRVATTEHVPSFLLIIHLHKATKWKEGSWIV
jgi:hypothetical protein